MRPASFSTELKRKIAALYLENRKTLEELEPAAMESFASELLEMLAKEKEKAEFFHDLEVLEGNMKHLKDDAAVLKSSKPGTDDYQFARNDCKNLVNSMKKWLELERLI